MGGFLIGASLSALLAVVTYAALVTFDVEQSPQDEAALVALEGDGERY
ncbi:hypothetical protein [Halovulum marinum]|nr:hypothetical protein [Halovulum marinum]